MYICMLYICGVCVLLWAIIIHTRAIVRPDSTTTWCGCASPLTTAAAAARQRDSTWKYCCIRVIHARAAASCRCALRNCVNGKNSVYTQKQANVRKIYNIYTYTNTERERGYEEDNETDDDYCVAKSVWMGAVFANSLTTCTRSDTMLHLILRTTNTIKYHIHIKIARPSGISRDQQFVDCVTDDDHMKHFRWPCCCRWNRSFWWTLICPDKKRYVFCALNIFTNLFRIPSSCTDRIGSYYTSYVWKFKRPMCTDNVHMYNHIRTMNGNVTSVVGLCLFRLFCLWDTLHIFCILHVSFLFRKLNHSDENN